jgi:hypothetical protein
MNAARIALVVAGLAAFVAYALFRADPTVTLLGLGLPVWLGLESCWHLLDPKR